MNKKSNKKKKNRKKNDNIYYKRCFIILSIIIFLLIIEQAIMISLFFSKNEKVVFFDSLPKIDVKELNNTFTTNELFEFDDLEIVFSSSYSFERITNKYSNYFNELVVKVPVTIKNKSDEEHILNIYDYTIYGPSKQELDEVAGYFDESVFYADKLEPEESYKKYLYFLYDSDGNYIVQFDKDKEHIKVVLKIKRKSSIKTQESFYDKYNNFL